MKLEKARLLALLCAAHASGCIERDDVLTTKIGEGVDRTDAGGDTDAPTSSDDVAVDGEPNGVHAVSAGTSHSCAVVDGSLFCWGENASGQLGLGDAELRTSPSRVSTGSSWRTVAAGSTHSCALDDGGSVYCWGGNDRGQLGQGDRQSRSTPVRVELPDRATALSTNFNHTCVLVEGGALICWGENFEGQLGLDDAYPAQDNSAADGLSPQPMGEELWSQVATGQGHTCGVRRDGSLWCWGRNTAGILATDEAEQIRHPVQVGADQDWSQADAGQQHSCGLRTGSLYCWGTNVGVADGSGAVFGSANPEQSTQPVRIGDFDDWSFVSSNTFHGCGLRQDELWCWGRAIEGQLGLEGIEVRMEPEPVAGQIQSVTTGRFHTCVVTEANTIECAGKNESGQLGTGDLERRYALSPIALPE